MEFHQHASHNILGELVIIGSALSVLAVYLAAFYSQRVRGRTLSTWRAASFTVGILILCLALIPAMAEFAHRDLRGHMIQHLMLGMVAPLGLVFAAPITLALKTLPATVGRKIVAFLQSRPVWFVSHPITALFLNVGGMYLLYLTPLYATTLLSPQLHILVHIHFIIAGCLFTWAIAGPDPGPHRPPPAFRLLVLFVSMAAHAILAKLMYAHGWPRGTGHDLEEIQQAAKLMYYGGDLTEVVLVAALFTAWLQAVKPVQKSANTLSVSQ